MFQATQKRGELSSGRGKDYPANTGSFPHICAWWDGSADVARLSETATGTTNLQSDIVAVQGARQTRSSSRFAHHNGGSRSAVSRGAGVGLELLAAGGDKRYSKGADPICSWDRGKSNHGRREGTMSDVLIETERVGSSWDGLAERVLGGQRLTRDEGQAILQSDDLELPALWRPPSAFACGTSVGRCTCTI